MGAKTEDLWVKMADKTTFTSSLPGNINQFSCRSSSVTKKSYLQNLGRPSTTLLKHLFGKIDSLLLRSVAAQARLE